MADTMLRSARILINGHKVKEYHHNDKIFIESRVGSEYEIELKNNSFNRVLAVISVDGIDVIQGKPADDNSPGYIVNGNSSIKVKGFRKDSDEVGAFKFTERDNSYSQEVGSGGNQGVIGVRFYEEKLINTAYPTYPITPIPMNPLPTYPTPMPIYPNYPYPGSPVWYCVNTSDYCSDATLTNSDGVVVNCSCEFNHGTTWGTKKLDKVSEGSFGECEYVGEVLFYYASRKSLIDMGVPLIEQKMIAFPKAFNKFCEPPKNWEK